jgi:hypothetical protein
MRFYLGCHKAAWLADPAVDYPLFVSHRTLAAVRKLRPATTSWALDSGGFTELQTYGRWTLSAADYARAVARYDAEIGGVDWAAPQDWMCEPAIIHGGTFNGQHFAGTGLSVDEHQRRTVDNFLQLGELWRRMTSRPSPFVPVLQGWSLGDYDRCAALYQRAGVDLASQRAVGLGSVCRRQSTIKIALIVGWFAGELPLHGFGVKTTGLASFGSQLASADSLSWSLDARRNPPMPGHTHKSCANCQTYARDWRADLLDRMEAA